VRQGYAPAEMVAEFEIRGLRCFFDHVLLPLTPTEKQVLGRASLSPNWHRRGDGRG
jgi:hypothetical protein